MLTGWAIGPGRVPRGHPVTPECTVVLRGAGTRTWTVTGQGDDLASRVRDGWRVLIQDGDVSVVSGPVTSVAPDLADHTVTLDGVSDLVHVEDRLIYPDPSRQAESQKIGRAHV